MGQTMGSFVHTPNFVDGKWSFPRTTNVFIALLCDPDILVDSRVLSCCLLLRLHFTGLRDTNAF